jgi:squalene-hopene cyclase-like protein
MWLRVVAGFVSFAMVACFAPARGAEPEATQAAVSAAIEKSLPLLMQGAVGHRENRTCFACHNQGLPIVALTAAKDHGFTIDEEELGKQTAFIARFLDGNRENYLQGKGQGGQADTAGYALWTLAAAGWKSDETTAAVTEYLLQRHKEKEYWQNTSNRPPSEAGPFTTTYVALYGLTWFGTAEQQQRIDNRTEQVRDWLIKAPAKDNEDRVFRLLALKQASAAAESIEAAAKELLAKQRADGGWAQLDGGEPASAIESDAYATGSALVALHEAGGLADSDPAYQKGIAYLLKIQAADGSWHVISRSKPFQPYYESGFPHGKDQFISCAASGWATWAMVLATKAGAD